MADVPSPRWASPLPRILDTPSLNMLAGASGIGKTALIASIACRFRDGAKLFGHQITAPPAVGYLSADRGGASARLWFDAAGYPDIPQYSLVDDAGFDIKQLMGKYGGADLLAYCIDQVQLPPGSLLFIDPIALFVGSNLLDYRAVAIACISIQRWLTKHPYCLIGVCHTSKQKGDAKDRYLRPQDRILGTGALLGYTSTQMYLMAPEESGSEDGCHTFLWNPHHAREESFQMKKGPEGLFVIDEAQVPLSTELEADLMALLMLFPPADRAISTAQLVKMLNTDVGHGPLPQRTLTRRLRTLEERRYIWQPRKGLWARVPKE